MTITPPNRFSPSHSLEQVLDANPAIVRGFSRAASESLERGPLSLADRDRLVDRGVRLGLKRFDANLIIAVVEQRKRETPALRLAETGHDASTRKLPRWLAWTTVAAIQLMIGAGVWWVVT